ncbi:uncharacterized protein L201_008097 [Kwoniella dendrophila CBS 6074]|uniref:DNA repair protein Swi5/Sae3 n=1 Tax=Kwoniella dendrophila CBS 6074 TaxID=1295534 RepID=A0AAX4K6F3_9TREE
MSQPSTSTSSSETTQPDGENTTIKLSIEEKQQNRIKALKEELEGLKIQLGDHDANQIVQNHIKLLHEYNEIKDTTQALIGKYAQITGRTVREIHVDMDLPLMDG